MKHSTVPEPVNPQIRFTCTHHGAQQLAAILGGAFERHLVLTCGCAFKCIGPHQTPIYASRLAQYIVAPPPVVIPKGKRA